MLVNQNNMGVQDFNNKLRQIIVALYFIIQISQIFSPCNAEYMEGKIYPNIPQHRDCTCGNNISRWKAETGKSYIVNTEILLILLMAL